MLVLDTSSNNSWSTGLVEHYHYKLVQNWIKCISWSFLNIIVIINSCSDLNDTVITTLNITLDTFLFVHMQALKKKLK